jgi:3-methylcrotonyl-CoA carboxylase alpha subunit
VSDTSAIPFKRILIANRGEIAIRITQAIHKLGAEAVAIYSDADARAKHVAVADRAVRVGVGPAHESYLDIDAIIAAAEESGAEAIHPGYGFLSERAEFAEAVIKAGIVFIGPPPEVMRTMGDKVRAKKLVAANGVPVVEGYDGNDQSLETLASEVRRIGFPLMIKAAAGGGGRGMRLVQGPQGLDQSLESARREAQAAFGDGRVFLERFIENPRHIEIQVLGDQHGNLIHLFERDCSVQRRHQKVIEESPSPALTAKQRAEVCELGLKAAQAAGYQNAGTVEFLWSGSAFHFLEMNTRIQVEHGVTEILTGVDLVVEQIRIAAGLPLQHSQSSIHARGHAIEARLYAEDADRDFAPQFGVLDRLSWAGHGTEYTTLEGATRIDSGYRSGDQVPRFYDSMLAKVITLGETRDAARIRLIEELSDVEIAGVKTNREFLVWLLTAETFAEGRATTNFLQAEWRPGALPRPLAADIDLILLAAAADVLQAEGVGGLAARVLSELGPWRVGRTGIRLGYRLHGARYLVEASNRRGAEWAFVVNGEEYSATVEMDGEGIRVVVGDRALQGPVARCPESVRVILDSGNGHPVFGTCYRRVAAELREKPSAKSSQSSTGGKVYAPMPGTVVKLSVAVGDVVEARQQVAVLEAMKMEHGLEAPTAGVVKEVRFNEGDLVTTGDEIVVLAPE